MKNLRPTTFIFFILFLNFSLGNFSFAQELNSKETQDSIKQNEEVSNFRKFYSKYLFKSKRPAAAPKTIPINPEVAGKPIRHIYITTHDPFGYSLQDSTQKPEKWIEKAGNSLHGKTKRFVVKELLLFKKGQTLDTVKIKESERLLRSQRILRRVQIDPKLTINGDSVDVYVNTIDSWSIIATGSVSSSKIGVRIRERNFAGLGHVFDNRYHHNYETGNNLYQFNYTVPNIAKSRVIGNIHYYKNEEEHFNKSISLQRPFYSPLAKIAGGVTIGQTYFQDSLNYDRNDMEYQNFKYNYIDIWGAKAFRISKKEEKNITNLIVSARYYDRRYKESPHFLADPYRFFSDQKNYFVGIGISSKHYVKDQYIFNFGIDEDIAVGRIAGIIGGIQDRPFDERYYLAGRAAAGGYLSTGYLGAEVQYGSFFREGKSEQTTFNFKTLYFSKLMTAGRWKFRQFSRVHYTVGFNRWDTPADELTLNENDFGGMDGIRKGRTLMGNQRLMVELQTQSYSPYEFLGFRISPFVNLALGAVGRTNNTFFDKNNVVTRLALGVVFTNDYFIFNNFQISFSFYPRIPGEGTNLFKTNVIDNRDFELMDFDFSKPAYIRWNRWD